MEKIKIEIYIAIANHYLLKEPQLVVNYSDSAEQIVGKSTEFGDYLPKLNLLKGQAFNRQSLHLEAQFYLDKEHSIT